MFTAPSSSLPFILLAACPCLALHHGCMTTEYVGLGNCLDRKSYYDIGGTDYISADSLP